MTIVTVDKNICPHNHVCPLIQVCPYQAISQGKDGYPIIDEERCVGCGACVKRCPMKAMKLKSAN
jgi:Predicted ATPase, RNase L inhibitor (RLI) homolog